MIIGKINPTATKIEQVNPFSSITHNLEYMTAIARPYVPGASKTEFEVQFGNVITDNEGNVIEFNGMSSEMMILTKDDLSTWGTNDETLLNIVASKLNVSITQFVDFKSRRFN